jgi:hypothetical protein
VSRQQRGVRNPSIGHFGEIRAAEWLRDRGVRVGLVPDHDFADVPAQDRVDGVFLEDLCGDLAGEIVAAGTPFDAKAAAFRKADGSTTRRGDFQIRRRPHEWLLERDGEYVLLVYDDETVQWDGGVVDGVGDWLAIRLCSARTVEAHITSWVSDRDAFEDVARVPWSRLLDPDRVNRAGGDGR